MVVQDIRFRAASVSKGLSAPWKRHPDPVFTAPNLFWYRGLMTL